MNRVDVAIAIVVKDQAILICQRKPGGPLAGYWEFPGGKLEPGESLRDCALRELAEEVGITAVSWVELPVIEHDYGDRVVRLHPFLCEYQSGELQCLHCQRAQWVSPEELANYRFPPANDSLLPVIRQYVRGSARNAPS